LLKNYHYIISTKDALHNIQECIQEALSVDVWSQYQTKKARTGNSKAERADRMKKVHHSATDKIANTNENANENGNENQNKDRRIRTQKLDDSLIKCTVRSGVLLVEENYFLVRSMQRVERCRRFYRN